MRVDLNRRIECSKFNFTCLDQSFDTTFVPEMRAAEHFSRLYMLELISNPR